DQAFRAALVGNSDRPVDFLREWIRGDGGAFFESDAERTAFLRKKYRRFSVDLLVTLDGTGLDFARRHRAELWPNAPLLFCGLSEVDARSRPRPPKSAGIALADDPAETIALALALQPLARRIVAIDGVGGPNLAIQARVRESLRRIPRRVELEFLSAGSVPALLDSLRRVPNTSIVLYALSDRDSWDLGQRSRDLVKRISEASSAPVYGFRESAVSQGIVGGVASSIEDHGSEAAELALKVLAGQNPDAIPLAETSPAARADWLQLTRWNLDESKLPPDTELRNVRPKIWQSYQREVIVAAVTIGVLTAVVLALLLWRAGRRVAEDRLRRRLEFERLLSETSASVAVVSREGGHEEIERPLERVVASMGLERCGLFLVRPGQSHATISHVAQARGARPIEIGFGGELLPRLNDGLREGRAVELDGAGAVRGQDANGEGPRLVLVPVSREGDSISGILFQRGAKNRALPPDMVSRMLLIGQILLSAVTRRGTEALLRSSEEKYRTVVDSQSDLICRYLPDTTLTFVNEAYCRYFGVARDELIGRRFLDLLPERSRGPVRQHVLSLVENPRAEVEEHEVLRPDGSVGWLRWSEHAIFAPDGRIVEFQGIGRDITDRKRMQEAEGRLANAARLTVLGELATSIAHEIRQPLGAILANTEAAQLMLDTGPTDEKQLAELREILDDIQREDLRASAVIHHIRSLMQHRPPLMEALSMNTIVRDVVRFVAPEARDRHVRVDLDLSDSLPSVSGDRVQLQQVLMNLIVNGIDAISETPDAVRTLWIRTSGRDGEVVVEVKDAGHGIASEVLSRLFQSFVTTRRDGLGLGLSLSRTIMESHGGRITAENNPHRGATFRCVLPTLSEAAAASRPPGRTA
ncbi:MAG TPA: ATP-binding protein, partial [Thermoanaerobaculia bacterium]|nr:ATP-binding protein [Thermoanaerobaculia bacterium]